MEISKKTLDTFNKFVRLALDDPDNTELEVILKGGLDVPSIRKEQYLRVLHALKSKGIPGVENDEVLNVIVDSRERTQFRASITGTTAIQKYCMTDRLLKGASKFLEKRTLNEVKDNPYDDYDNGFRINLKSEKDIEYNDELSKSMRKYWATHKKMYRLIKRTSFDLGPFRVDCSIVRSSRRSKSGE